MILHHTGVFLFTKSVPTVKRRCLQDPHSAAIIRQKFQEETLICAFASSDVWPRCVNPCLKLQGFHPVQGIQYQELQPVKLFHVSS